MTISRRGFAATSIAALALGGWARLGSAQSGDTYRNEVQGYGPLRPDPAGYFDLPEGFSYRVLAKAGETMDDGFIAPDNFDGMGCFALPDGHLALVRNHELSLGSEAKGPAGTDPALEARLAAAGPFDRGQTGRVLPGGTTTLLLDPKGEQVLRQHLSLAGTSTNCAGGITPWGSWLTCEETHEKAGEGVGQDHGWVFEVPASARGPVDPVPLKAMGRFDHEAACVDPLTGVVYLTEDEDDSLFYRFIPNTPGRLHEGGRLQALAIEGAAGADLRNWAGVQTWNRGDWLDVRWIDLDDVESPNADLRLRGHAAGAALFARGEGLTWGDGELYATCTSGGPSQFGQIVRLVPGRDGARDRIQLFLESGDDRVYDYGDNLTVTPWGDLLVCEDRYSEEAIHLRAITPDGRAYTVARNAYEGNGEFCGVCVSPDASTVFLNIQKPGITLAITGPWSSLRNS